MIAIAATLSAIWCMLVFINDSLKRIATALEQAAPRSEDGKRDE